MPNSDEHQLELEYFQQNSFDTVAFLESIYPGDSQEPLGGEEDELEIRALHSLDLDFIESQFAKALQGIDALQDQVDKLIADETTRNQNETENLQKLLQDQLAVHSKLGNDVSSIEARFGEIAPSIIGIGRELEGLSKERVRMGRAEDLLIYYNSFLQDANPNFPIFKDWPNRLVDAAFVLSQLRQVAAGVTVGETEKGRENIASMSDRVLEELLNTFDRASRRTDLDTMKYMADAVMRHFTPLRGAQLLFGRFVFRSLEPLTSTRTNTTSFKLAAMQDNLALLFRQMRTIVRTQYELVRVVFPDHRDQVMALLVERLFNDTAHGLLPVLEQFLNPPHAPLPNYEFLQVLAESYHKTQMLSQELVNGIVCNAPTQAITPVSVANTDIEYYTVPYQQPTDSARSLGSAESFKSNNSATTKTRMIATEHIAKLGNTGQSTMTVRFDPSFVHKQMHSVFRPFTNGYLQKEMSLFAQRCSQALYSALPADFVSIHQPNLPKVDGLHISSSFPDGNGIGTDTNEEGNEGTNEQVISPVSPNGGQKRRSGRGFADVVQQVQEHVTDKEEGRRASSLRKLEKFITPLTLDIVNTLGCQHEAARDATSYLGSRQELAHGLSIPQRMIRWILDAKLRCDKIMATAHQQATSDSGVRSPNSRKNSIPSRTVEDSDSSVDQRYSKAVCDLFDLLTKTLIDGLLIPAIDSSVSNMPKIMSPNAPEQEHGKHLGSEVRVVNGSDGVPLRAGHLPLLLTSNNSVKKTATGVSQLLKAMKSGASEFNLEDFISKVASPHPELVAFIAICSQTMRIVNDLVELWAKYLKPVLLGSGKINDATAAESQLIDKLQQLDLKIASGVDHALSLASIHLQAIFVALQSKNEYAQSVVDSNQADDSSNQFTLAGRCFTRSLAQYLEACDTFMDESAKIPVRNRLVLLGRDVLLGNLRRCKVGQVGAFILKADWDLFEQVVRSSGTLSQTPELIEMLDELNFIPPLFLVKSEHLTEMLSLESVGPTTSFSLCRDCISCRADGKQVEF